MSKFTEGACCGALLANVAYLSIQGFGPESWRTGAVLRNAGCSLYATNAINTSLVLIATALGVLCINSLMRNYQER